MFNGYSLGFNLPDPRIGTLGRRRHKCLYVLASSFSNIGFYDNGAKYFGYEIAHYRYNWKLNKAERVW